MTVCVCVCVLLSVVVSMLPAAGLWPGKDYPNYASAFSGLMCGRTAGRSKHTAQGTQKELRQQHRWFNQLIQLLVQQL